MGVGLAGVVQDVGRGTVFHHLAAVHHQYVVGYLADDPQVVGDEEDGCAVPALQLPQQVEDGLLYRHVEGGGGFVGDEYVGFVDEGHGDHHALLLAAAEFVGVAVENLLRPREQHLAEELDDAVF